VLLLVLIRLLLEQVAAAQQTLEILDQILYFLQLPLPAVALAAAAVQLVNKVLMEDLAAVAVRPEMEQLMLLLEILHQHHHHKEIMVVWVLILLPIMAAVEVVVLVVPVLEQMEPQLQVEMVVLEQHLLFPEHQ
jgi:hypothetical protein